MIIHDNLSKVIPSDDELGDLVVKFPRTFFYFSVLLFFFETVFEKLQTFFKGF